MPENRAYLSLGSNIEPERNIIAALRLLDRRFTLLAVSTIWETEPLGLAGQPNFLNGAALIETDLSAASLKRELTRFEQVLGRVRRADKNAPRTIDLDIIFFNRAITRVDGRPIPSPELLDRDFVAIPLAEIDPDYVHPQTGQTLARIAAGFTATHMVERADVQYWPLTRQSVFTSKPSISLAVDPR